MKSIAERLRFVREKMGIGQVETATKFGIPVSSYRKYESGPSEPGSEAIAGIARAGINANWLLTGEGEMLLPDARPRPAPPDAPVLDQTRLRLALILTDEFTEGLSLTPEQRADRVLSAYNRLSKQPGEKP